MANAKSIRGGSVLVHLSEETNQLLVESSKRSGRSKTREAKIRLEEVQGHFPGNCVDFGGSAPGYDRMEHKIRLQ